MDIEQLKPGSVIAVLMGGPSEEHAVSLKSGRGVTEALAGRGWVVRPVTIPQDTTLAGATEWLQRALLALKPDVAFIALHGRFGEDGTVQTVCEDLRIPYTGSDPMASRIGLDKIASRKRFIEAGLRVPRCKVLPVDAPLSAREALGLRYPIVVKPVDQGSSIGVTMVKQPAELAAAMGAVAPFGPVALIEEFIAGRELTVGVLGSGTLPVVEIVPKNPFFDFQAKYTGGMTRYVVPAELDARTSDLVQEAGYRAHQAIGCRHLSRADVILDKAGIPYVLEVNTVPGFTPTSLLPKAAACVGLTYDALCEELILMARLAALPAEA